MLEEPLERSTFAGRRRSDAPPRPSASARYDIVISTLRKPSLSQLLLALDLARGPAPERVIVVDDRPRPADPRPLPHFTGQLRDRVELLSTGGRGQAFARNLGWRSGSAPWAVFLDEDVVPPREWLARLHSDLARLDEKVAGSRGRVRSPHPSALERDVISLESAGWLAADMAYRRAALEVLGGFDEWFLNAHLEETELSRRALAFGYDLSRGRRHVQRLSSESIWDRLTPDASDPRAAALHRIESKRNGSASGGRFTRHVVVTLGALASAAGVLASSDGLAWLGAITWLAGTADLVQANLPEGRCTARDAASLVASAVLIPPFEILQRIRVHGRFTWQLLRDLARRSIPGRAQTRRALPEGA
jgi:hypothetical protein